MAYSRAVEPNGGDDTFSRPSGPAPTTGQRVTLVASTGVWADRYADAARDIADALGDAITSADGRLLELHHAGSTAVPGLPAKPTLDLIGRLASWTLDEEAVERLRGRGYVDHGEHGLTGRRFFTRGGHDVHLHLWAPEGDGLARHLAFRDLLLDDSDVRSAYGALKRRLVEEHRGDREAYVDGKAAFVQRWTETAVRRRQERLGFAPVHGLLDHVTSAMTQPLAAGAWAIGGGWALDVALGRVLRPHDDVDVVLDRTVATDWIDDVVSNGVSIRTVAEASPRTESVARTPGSPLPEEVRRLSARSGPLTAPSPFAKLHDDTDPTFWDVVVERRRAGRWILRTDPAVTRAVERAIVVRPIPGGQPGATVPILAPEVVLLCKARLSGRQPGDAKDEDDLIATLPTLGDDARMWLRSALERPPRHPWAERL